MRATSKFRRLSLVAAACTLVACGSTEPDPAGPVVREFSLSSSLDTYTDPAGSGDAGASAVSGTISFTVPAEVANGGVGDWRSVTLTESGDFQTLDCRSTCSQGALTTTSDLAIDATGSFEGHLTHMENGVVSGPELVITGKAAGDSLYGHLTWVVQPGRSSMDGTFVAHEQQ